MEVRTQATSLQAPESRERAELQLFDGDLHAIYGCLLRGLPLGDFSWHAWIQLIHQMYFCKQVTTAAIDWLSNFPESFMLPLPYNGCGYSHAACARLWVYLAKINRGTPSDVASVGPRTLGCCEPL